MEMCTEAGCVYRTDEGLAHWRCRRHHHEVVVRRYAAVAVVVKALSGAGAFNCGSHRGYEYADQLVRGEFGP